jgi:hypothetical protein
MNLLRHARRAVPWVIVLGAAVPGSVMLVVAFAFHEQGWTAVPARGGLLLLAVPAAFLLDDPPASVTLASPRSPWWDLTARLIGLVAICTSILTLTWWWNGLMATSQAWLLGFIPCTAAVLAVSAAAALRLRGRNAPGDLVAAGIAFGLLGLALFRPAYRSWELLPFPGEAGPGDISAWVVVLTLATVQLLLSAGHRGPRTAVDA